MLGVVAPRGSSEIAPYQSVFKATKAFSGPVRFMLAGSGHIAGVVNPPSAQKYRYWTNNQVRRYKTPEEFIRILRAVD